MQKTGRINTRDTQKHDKKVFNLNNTIPHSVRLVNPKQIYYNTRDCLTIENFPPLEGISDLLGWKSLPEGQKFVLAVEMVK
jgi:hypothetical protein